jgi:(2Fe-2S) ferredoxin
VNPEMVVQIMEEHVKNGKVVADYKVEG